MIWNVVYDALDVAVERLRECCRVAAHGYLGGWSFAEHESWEVTGSELGLSVLRRYEDGELADLSARE